MHSLKKKIHCFCELTKQLFQNNKIRFHGEKNLFLFFRINEILKIKIKSKILPEGLTIGEGALLMLISLIVQQQC